MSRLAVVAGLALCVLGVLGVPDGAAQMSQWVPPACKLNTKHFLVNGAQLYLKNATQAKNPEQKQSNLKDAGRVLHEAVTTGGQADNPAVWYMYGRYYLLVDSLAGADSAFRKAQASQPDCADDIALQRRSAWVPNVQAAADALNKGNLAAAKEHFRRANDIFQGDPIGFYYLANVFINEGEIDSAITYFRKTIQVANKADTSQTETYETSIFNMGRLFHQQQKWDSAAVWYERYRQEKPGDTQALTGLAVVYDASGDSMRASKLYDDILANCDNVPTLDLFSAGIQLFRGNKYPPAARAFKCVLKKNPYYRDAQYNLASTYLSMGSSRDSTLTQAQKDSIARVIGEQMLPVTRQMVSIDGQNRNTLRMLAVAYQYVGQQDSTLKALEMAEALTYEVNVLGFQPVEKGYTLQGTETALAGRVIPQLRDSIRADSGRLATTNKGLQARTTPAAVRQALQTQKPVLERRMTETRGQLANALAISVPPITFEFIDAKGQTITSQTVAAANLEFYALDVCTALNNDKKDPPTYCKAIEALLLGRASPEQSALLTPEDRAKFTGARSAKDFNLTASGEGIQGWRYKIGG